MDRSFEHEMQLESIKDLFGIDDERDMKRYNESYEEMKESMEY